MAARKKPSRKKTTSKKRKSTAKKTARKKKVARKVIKKKTSRKKVAKKAAVKKKASKKKKVAKKKVVRKKVSGKKSAKKKAVQKKVVKKPSKKRTSKTTVTSKTATKAIGKADTAKMASKKTTNKVTNLTSAAPSSRRSTSTARKRKKVNPDSLIHGIEPYQVSKGEEFMSDDQLDHFRNILQAWKNELMQEADRTVHHMQDDASNFPDPNDRATQESEFGLELRTRDRERKLLKKISSAITRIDEGSYGYCEETGEEIGLQRLEARPVATMCVEAQERRELAERQYSDRDD
jgi:DnaK suppressor protein